MTESTHKPNADAISRSDNPADLKREALQDLLPEAFSEGRLDIPALKRALGEDSLVEAGERYRLDWVGKTEAYRTLQAPTTATLQPVREQSVNFDTANHAFIEGENLETLKVIQKAYFGQVKMIYIDPPYNTGSDNFVYPDRFAESKDEYLRRIEEMDDQGALLREGQFRKNSRESGHYHSNWLSMMLPRLYIARNLLRDDGAIFVSIDDHEVHNLRCLMNEVFGEENFVAQLIWKSRKFTDSRAKTNISTDHEYLLGFSKTNEFSLVGVQRDETKFKNPDNDPRGAWMSRSILGLATKEKRPNLHYPIEEPQTGRVFDPPENRGWRYSKTRMEALVAEGRILFPVKDSGRPREKKFRSELESDRMALPSIIDDIHTSDGTQEVRDRLGAQIFDFPKPTGLLKLLVEQTTGPNDLILDPFAGSGSMLEAVLCKNTEDNGNRRCILVQMAEPLDADNAEFSDIAQVARTRIRRALEELRASDNEQPGIDDGAGFRAFQLVPSHFPQWRPRTFESGDELAEQIQLFMDTGASDADAESIAHELLLKTGYALTTTIERVDLGDSAVHVVDDGALIMILEPFSIGMIGLLIERQPSRVIAVDHAFVGSDEVKKNLALQCRDAQIGFESY